MTMAVHRAAGSSCPAVPPPSASRIPTDRPGAGNRPRQWLGLLALMALAWFVALAAPAAAQVPNPEQAAIRERLEGQRAIVDSVEAGLGRDTLRASDLDELRARLDPVRGNLDQAIQVLEPRLNDLNNRVKEIGPKPADDAAPEEASITQEREQISARATEVDGLLKQIKLLKLRTDQISDRITSRRRALFTDTLFARSYSALDPQLWLSAARALPVEWRGVSYLLGDWRAYADTRISGAGQAAIAFGIMLIIGAAVAIRRMLLRPLRRFEREQADHPLSRFRAAALSVQLALVRSATPPAATAAALALANAFDLLPPRVDDISGGLMLAIVVASVGRGISDAALAPDAPRRRIVPIGDDRARLVDHHVSNAAIVLALATVLNTLHRTLVAPVALTVATSALMSIIILLLTARVMRSLSTDTGDAEEDDTSVDAHLQWLRLPIWGIIAATAAALVAGYVSLATFLASRFVVAVVLIGALYLVIALINGVFIDGLNQKGQRTRTLAKAIGIHATSLELLAVLAAGVLKLLAIVIVAVMVIGTWGTSTADLRDFVSRISFAFTLGSTTISLGDILSAVAIIAAGVLMARAFQSWISSNILPRTRLDPGLQNSISTIIGYVGSIAVIAVAMGQIGLNLENIALVAGALSVGIGFGLQSIVSNFVSGLILLAERPIRVGDMIMVKGEEGYVRRISVRATEIETFDRAAVLIPNSDLITGMVKNFTHANTTGRVIVPVMVGYDSDPDQVRDLLADAACDHPQVLTSPPPRVFLVKFGDSGLMFELRCVVANVDYAFTVKSDLHFAVFDRLRRAGIAIPYQSWSAFRGTPHPAGGADA
ncbi:DUF3772 domain-containing protein [Ancylobacter terrae]|uniref:DUF3772 domain-containing protein n=1 Tax=Ancylobacter sp. sgz301288 TaxID=3342077 RepID=UPI00385AA123